MSKEPKTYAPDLPLAESQKHHTGENITAPDKPPADIPAGRSTESSDSPYATHYRHDAQIWSLYLKETEAEDKELVQLWQAGLDSLLIFAGLFAAVLTAFLIESRKGLKEDPLERLLQEILNTIQNRLDQPVTFQASTSSLQVNYLWFTSLALTLSSALGGVLGKGWLAKYAPASPGVSSSDACERHLRAIRAYRWRFSSIIGSIPLLIQIAVFLFLTGLVLFILDSSDGIGYVMLCLTIFIAALYLLGTVLPWFSPACPFQTTMSDFIPIASGNARYNKDRASSYDTNKGMANSTLSSWTSIKQFVDEVRHKPKQTQLEASILSWIIANSTVEENIEEAVRVMAGMPSAHCDALRKAMYDSGAVTTLCERVSRCFKSSPGLQVASTSANQAEAYFYALRPNVAHKSCLKLWERGGPLHRWDNLQPCLQSLAFCVRTEILLSSGEDDHQENWEQTKRNLVLMCQTGLPSNLHNMLLNVAVRSLEGNRYRLQRSGAIVLSSLVKTGKSVQQFGLFGAEGDIYTIQAVIRTLLELSSDDDAVISDAALRVLTVQARYDVFRDLIKIQIVNLLKGREAQSAGALNTIGKLSGNDLFHDAIKDSCPQIAQFFKHDNSNVRMAAANLIIKLLEHASLHNAVKDAIVPQIAELLVDKHMDVKSAGADAVIKLIEHDLFHDAIKYFVPQMSDLLKTNGWWYMKSKCISAINITVDRDSSRHAIDDSVPQILEFLKDDDWRVRAVGVNAVGKLCEHTCYHDAIKITISQFGELLKDSSTNLQSDSVDAVGTLVKHSYFHNDIKDLVPSILELLKSDGWNDKFFGAKLIGKLVEHPPFRDAIKDAVPRILKLLSDDDLDVRSAGVDVIDKLVEHSMMFHDAIKDAFSHVAENLTDSNWYVRSTGIAAIEKLAGRVAFHDTIGGVLPQIIGLLKDVNSNVRLACVGVMIKFIEHNTFHEVVQNFVPLILGFLKSNDPQAQSASASAIGQLAEHGLFLHMIENAVPQIVELLKDDFPDVRTAGANAIVKFAKHTSFHDAIKSAGHQIIEFLKINNSDVQLLVINAVNNLAEHTEILHTLQTEMPRLHADLVKGSADNEQVSNNIIKAIGRWSDSVTWLGDGLSVFLTKFSTVPVISDSSSLRGEIYERTPRNVISSSFSNLVSKKCELRHNAIQCLSLLFHYIRNSPVDSNYMIKKVISQLESKEARVGAVVAMTNWSKNTLFHDEIKDAVPKIIMWFKEENMNVHSAAANAVGELAEHEFFHGVIRSVIPQIVEVLRDRGSSDRSGAVDALTKLIKHTSFHAAINDAVSQIIELLNHENWDTRRAANDAIKKMVEHTIFHDAIKDAIPRIIEFVKSNSWNREAVIETIETLAGHESFNHIVKDALPSSRIVELLKDNNSYVRLTGIYMIGALAKHASFHHMVVDVVPHVVDFLKDTNPDIRSASADTIGKLPDHASFYDTVKCTLPQTLELLKDEYFVCVTAGRAISKLSEYALFQDIIKDAVPRMIELLKESDLRVRSAAAEVIVSLVDQVFFHDAIKNCLLHIVNSFKEDVSYIREINVNSIGKMAAHDISRDVVMDVFSQIIELLESDKADDQLLWFALGVTKVLAEHVSFHDKINVALPKILNLLKKDEWVAKFYASDTISKLVEYASFRHHMVKDALRQIVMLLNEDDLDVRSNGATIIRKLIEDNMFHDELFLLLTKILKTGTSFAQSATMDLLSELPSHELSRFVKTFDSSDFITVLQHRDSEVSASSARFFCLLSGRSRSLSLPNSDMDKFSDLTLNVVLYALTCFDSFDLNVQSRGIAILNVLMADENFREIISEVGTIHGFLRTFVKDIPPDQQDKLLYCLQEYGILRSL